MGNPTGHGQKNKAHKAGRAAGLSARKKQKLGKEVSGPAHRQPAKAGSAQGGKVERQAAAKQHRDAKRQELLDRKRKAGAPIVVALLPLSENVDVGRLWSNLLAACQAQEQPEDGAKEDRGMDVESDAPAMPVSVCTVCPPVKGRPIRLTLLPPPSNRQDLLAVVDIGKAAEVLLLAVPGSEQHQSVDAEGEAALAVLRALGLPGLVVAVQGGGSSGGGSSSTPGNMKERSAAKKRAEKAVTAQIAGNHKYFHVDTNTDCQQLMRHLAEHPVTVPVWRRQRPALMIEAAEFRADEQSASTSSPTGTLLLTGYVRYAGLSANQLVHVPGAGDFQIDIIEGLPESPARAQPQHGGTGAAGMDTSGSGPALLAKHDPEEREGLERENEPDPMDGEQTWPTDQELLDVEKLVKGKARRRKLPAGTSEYQAAWILDDDEDEDEDESEGGEDDAAMAEGSEVSEAPELANIEDEDEDEGNGEGEGEGGEGEGGEGTGEGKDEDEGNAAEGMALDDEDESKAAALHEELRSRHRQRQYAEEEQAEYPDEVDVPTDLAARIRFQKYRGLKSFRSSPWDAKEWLPHEYAKVFAFENFKRAHKRAKAAVERATSDLDPCAVAPGVQVVVHLVGVPAHLAAAVIERVKLSMSVVSAGHASALPLMAFGLMQHESRLSVVHFGVKKASTYQEPIPNKEQLLFVTGVRMFTARPIFSADNPGDKHKMERFLHTGSHAVASVYAPISYGPLPLLAFKVPQDEGLPAQLAAAGTVRSCDPDRIVLKKITLTGYPVRVHKKTSTVRFMFHNPDDIRWFRPVELYTKYGRRGRITEPIGTHGAMKCLFDGPLQQRDAVCMSLYKRAFPKWPSSLDFA